MNTENNKEKPTAESATAESFAELFKQTPAQNKSLEAGRRLEAKIVGASEQYLFLDVGGKSEGCIAKSEFVDPDGNLLVNVGDIIKVYFLSLDKGALFTSRLGGGSVSTAHLEAAFEKQVPVEGLVEKEIKGGFEVKVTGNVRAFCPYSQMGLHRLSEPAACVGQRLPFRITEFGESGRNIILSHRVLLEEERQVKRDELKESLAVGQTVRGLVSSIRDFGAFIDLGGVDGLIPISEIGWGRVENINEFLAVGQEVEAVVLQLDWEKNRISLSLKQAMPDPWQDRNQIPRGSIHSCTVCGAKFGAFVTLITGWTAGAYLETRQGKASTIRAGGRGGQSLEIRIDKIDKQNKRISPIGQY
jgi:small subunit ribosomal protein S1